MVAVASLSLTGAGLGAGPAAAAPAAPAAPVAASAQASTAAGAGVTRPGEQQVVRASRTSGGTAWQGISSARSGAPQARAMAAPTAVINVNYSAGFNTQAKAAFQGAVEIWKTQIRSSVPITINAEWTPLDTGVLGQAGPLNFRRDFLGAPQAGLYYPDALANSLAGRDLDPANPEIFAKFNSTLGAWYYGTDGKPSTNTYDLQSVVLHELGHGLGLVGSLEGYTYTPPNTWTDGGRGYWGLGSVGDKPTIFDRLVVDGLGRDALNTSVYPQGSLAMGKFLRGANGGSQWKGPEGILGASGVRPKMYSPTNYESGSSVSHLDENLYKPGTPNALMTPFLQNGESALDPGPIVRGMFQDMGWGAPSACAKPTGTTSGKLKAQVTQRRGTVAMTGGVTFNLPMLGRAGLPSGGVDAVLATVEMTKPSASGFLQVGPGCGATTASVQQYTANVSRTALVSTPLDSLGRLQLRISGGASNVSVYVHGYYASDGTTSGLFTALPKSRASGAVVKAGAPIDVATNGVGGLPATGVEGVLLNVTVVTPTAAGNLLVGPGGATPAYAQQAYSTGRSISQLIVAKRDAAGKVRVGLTAGSGAVLVDVWGYYGAASPKGSHVMHRTVPTRVLNGSTNPDVTFTVPGLPAGTRSVVLVTTVAAPTANGWIGAAAGGSTVLPGVVQYYKGDAIANLAVVPLGPNNTVRFKLYGGTGKLYADLLGYHGP
jgi:hypothetical protein